MTDRFAGHRKLWIAVIFPIGMAAGAFVIELTSHSRRMNGAATQDSPREEKETAGRLQMDAAAQKNIGLQTERAQSRPIARTIQATGVVSPNESRLAHVRPLARSPTGPA